MYACVMTGPPRAGTEYTGPGLRSEGIGGWLRGVCVEDDGSGRRTTFREGLVAATAAKHELRGGGVTHGHGRVTGRDATRAPLSPPQPIVPSCRLQIGGETLTCDCLLDQGKSQRSWQGAGAAGEYESQRSCEREATP